MRSLPMRLTSTASGTLPRRKPGILTLPARSDAACSTACFTSALGTSTVRRTLLSPSSSTWACIERPLEQTSFGLRRGLRRAPVYRVSAAGVAELADAPGLGPGGLRPLEVRVLSPALTRHECAQSTTRLPAPTTRSAAIRIVGHVECVSWFVAVGGGA